MFLWLHNSCLEQICHSTFEIRVSSYWIKLDLRLMTEMKFTKQVSVYTGKCEVSYNGVIPILRHEDMLQSGSKVSWIFNFCSRREVRKKFHTPAATSSEKELSVPQSGWPPELVWRWRRKYSYPKHEIASILENQCPLHNLHGTATESELSRAGILNTKNKLCLVTACYNTRINRVILP
jgi:hypothetical protein